MRNWIDCCEAWGEKPIDQMLRIQHNLMQLAQELDSVDAESADQLRAVSDRLEVKIAAAEDESAARRAENERRDRERYGDDI